MRRRGAALGAVLGLAHGLDALPRRWVDGLVQKESIAREAEALGEWLQEVIKYSLHRAARYKHPDFAHDAAEVIVTSVF